MNPCIPLPDFVFHVFLSSLDSLRCHPEDQQPNTDVVPPDATLKTLVYDSSSLVTIHIVSLINHQHANKLNALCCCCFFFLTDKEKPKKITRLL